jgi:phosphate transport system protein
MATHHIVKSYDQEIALLSRKVLEMGGLVEHQIASAIDALVKRSVEDAARVVEHDDQIDRMEEEVDQHAIRLLATRQPMAIDLRVITMAMKIGNDLERIGDYAANIAKRCQRLAAHPPVKPLYTIPRMAQITQAMVKEVLDAYVERDVGKAVAAWHRDDEVDEMYTSVFRELLTYMMEDPRNISPCLDLIAVAKHLERMADHATNIAEKIHYMVHAQRINRLPQPQPQPQPAAAPAES